MGGVRRKSVITQVFDFDAGALKGTPAALCRVVTPSFLGFSLTNGALLDEMINRNRSRCEFLDAYPPVVKRFRLAERVAAGFGIEDFIIPTRVIAITRFG